MTGHMRGGKKEEQKGKEGNFWKGKKDGTGWGGKKEKCRKKR